MTFEVINNSIEFNDLISTLLVFEIYLRMIEMNASSFIITQRIIAMRKVMKEVRKLNAMRQMNDVLNTRNELFITFIHDLPLNSLILIFRESNTDQSESWKESFKLLSIQSESTIVELSSESTKFRSISVKSYYQDNHVENEDSSSSNNSSFATHDDSSSSNNSLFATHDDSSSLNNSSFATHDNSSLSNNSLFATHDDSSSSNNPSFATSQSQITKLITSQSPNSSSIIESQVDFEHTNLIIDSIVRIESVKRGRERSRKYFFSIAYLNFILNSITSLDSSFIASRQQEIAKLLEKDVFLSVNKIEIFSDVRIFSFRFVNEIKHSSTAKTFEKFRLIVQAFKNQNKIFVLTQSLIIQRISRRLIICLAVTLSQIKLYLRNIIQIYVQSRSILNRDFYVQSFFELIKLMKIFTDCILKVIKSSYDVSKADNRWFKTYHDHHIDKLEMIQFIYDSCLLYIIDRICISIVDMQIDDTLILADQSFAAVENKAINFVKIMIKTREQLSFEHLLKFNDIRIERIDSNDAIYFRKESHIQNIQLINSIEFTISISVHDKIWMMLISKEQYIAQRVRETYLISIRQSEASFDLSRAAQSTKSLSMT
jgi:hypothetical protein